MRCFNYPSCAQEGTTLCNMIRMGNAVLACLLLGAAFIDCVDAARPRDQRWKDNPYLVSPPGSPTDDNVRPQPKDLGEKIFVSDI